MKYAIMKSFEGADRTSGRRSLNRRFLSRKRREYTAGPTSWHTSLGVDEVYDGREVVERLQEYDYDRAVLGWRAAGGTTRICIVAVEPAEAWRVIE